MLRNNKVLDIVKFYTFSILNEFSFVLSFSIILLLFELEIL